jgi:hypothetical protein
VGQPIAKQRFFIVGGAGFMRTTSVKRILRGRRCELSTREALRRSIAAMIPEMQAGRM